MVICNSCGKFTILECGNCHDFCCWSCLSKLPIKKTGYWCPNCLKVTQKNK